MPIELYTGKPGNGKTAFMMVDLMAQSEKAERPIFASGIDGLGHGLATVIDDPTTWNDIDPNGEPVCTCDAAPEAHAHVLPNGAKWYVDEAWKWFGHLQAPPKNTPAHVLALAEHRHRGIDMLWTTQGPNQLFPFARPLVAQHRHHVRRYNTSFVDVFAWEELQEDVKSSAKRELAHRSTVTLPAKVFGTYKSADVHTIKRKIPMQVLALPLMILAVIAMGAGVFWWMAPDTEKLEAHEAASSEPSRVAAGSEAAKAPKYETVADYVTAHTPRIAALPGSAPIFDGRTVASKPALYCVVGGSGIDGTGEQRGPGCLCLTEQGTPYALPENECRTLATTGGVYDPYKEPQQTDSFAAPARDFQPNAPSALASNGAPGGVMIEGKPEPGPDTL